MKTLTILTTTPLVALLASLSVIACGGAELDPADQSQTGLSQSGPDQRAASEAMRPEASQHQGGRGDERRRGRPSPEKMIERFDANKNGLLEAGELPERLQERIGDIDTSGDSVVSKDELAAHFKAKLMAHAKERFKRHDSNQDGTLDATELGEKRWTRLSVADQNGDQKLTADELRAAFESGKLKPMRGKHARGEHAERQAPVPAAPAP